MIINWLPAALLSSARPSARHARRARTHQQSRLRVENVESRVLLANPVWTAEGPGPIDGGGGTLGIANNPSVGAIRSIVVDPSNPNTVYVATVNGGIWKSTNATNASPTWTAETDAMPSLSTSSISMDPGNNQVLVAGTGRYSSDAGDGGPLTGVMLTTDGGATWQSLDGHGVLDNVNISAVLVRNNGSTIIVASAEPPLSAAVSGQTGIYRSTDGGATFSRLSGNGLSGLPAGDVFDLVADPNTPATLYAAVGNVAAGAGIYKSTDNGATWTKISNATQDGELAAAAGTQENAKIAVGVGGVVDVVIDDTTGGVSTDFVYQFNGAAWTTLDSPSKDGNLHTAGMGMIYLSIAADTTSGNIVYVGGDQEPSPNTIGAAGGGGRLFRIDASKAAGTQVTELTNNASTSSNTTPPANSRFMVMDSTGRLLEADDGGIYVRTTPGGTGNWASMIGNLADAELVSTTYESDSHRIYVSAQGNSSAIQSVPGSATYNSIPLAFPSTQPGSIAIDPTSIGEPRVFTSQGFLNHFQETDYNNGVAGPVTLHNLTDTASGKSLQNGVADPSVSRYTPLVINLEDPTHALVLTDNIWESLNSFNTVTDIWSAPAGATVTAAIYGGAPKVAGNTGVIVAGDSLGDVIVRQSQAATIDTFTLPSGVAVKAIVTDPADWTQSYILDANGTIWHLNYTVATHAGTFTQVATLPAPNGTGYEDWRTLAAVPTTTGFALVAGGYGGVFSVDPTAGTTKQLGTLPNAVVNNLVYNKTDDVLVAGTLGRGAYLLSAASTFLASTTPSITIPSGSVTFNTPPHAPVILATGATVNEPVAGVDFHNGNLTVAITNGVAGDSLAIQNAGTISTSGNGVFFNGNQIGTFAGGAGSTPLVVTFLNNSFETKAAVQALVRHITFDSTSFAAAARNVTFQVTDSQPQSSAAVPVTVNVVLATAPILVIAPGPVTLNNAPNSQPVLLAAGGTLIDTGTPSFQGGELSVTISNNLSANDQLLVQSIGGITLNGGSVLYNGNVIGLLTGGVAGSPLTVQFTTVNATTAAVQALIQAIAFNNTVDPVSTAQRTVTFQVFDSLHVASNSANVLVNVKTADTPPVIALNAVVATYTEGNPPVTLAPGAAVAYNDGTNFPGGSLTVSLSANGTPADQLTIQSLGGITLSGANVLFNNNIIGNVSGGANGTPLLITFTTPQATIAAAQALIRAIGFSNNSNNPSTLPRMVQFVLNDGRGGLSAPAAMTVNVIPVDNSPTLVLGPSATYFANTPAAAIAPSAIVTDPDTPFFTGGTLIVSESLGSPNDQLEVLNQGNGAHQIGVSGASVFDAGTLIGTITSFGSPSSPLSISLNGNASVADVQDLVRAVGFGVNGPASQQSRFFSFSLNDGGGAAPATASTSVAVNNGNTAPIVIVQPAVNYISGSVPVLVSPVAVVSDPDSLDFNGGSLMVTLGAGGTANDRLSIQSQGGVLVNGQNVYFGGVLVGTLTAGAGIGLTPLVVNFKSQSSAVSAQAILGAVQFSTFGPLSAGVRSMQVTVTDNHQLTSTPATEQIDVTLPASPVVITMSSPATTYQRGSSPILIDAGVTLSDINAANFPGGSLIFQVRGGTNNKAAIASTMDIRVQHGKVSFDGLVIGKLQGNTVHLNANATVPAVQALLQAVKFSTRGIPGNRTATFMFNDGISPIVFASRTIIVN